MSGLVSYPTAGLGGLLTSNDSSSSLTSILLPEAKNLWFNGQDVYLDGWKYVSCRFDNCRFFVNTSNFILDKCFIDDTNSFHFNGEALKAIQIFNRNNEWMRGAYSHFAAKKNADGTISVGA